MGAFSPLRIRICISISITCTSPHSAAALGRELVLCSPSAAPHCTSIREDMGLGVAQTQVYRNKLMLQPSPVRYVCLCPKRTLDMFGPLSHPFLHAAMGKAAGLCPAWFQTPALTWSPVLQETAANKRRTWICSGLSLQVTHPPAFSILAGVAGERAASPPWRTRPCLVSCRVVLVLTTQACKQAPIQKSPENIANVLVTGVEQGSKSCSPS